MKREIKFRIWDDKEKKMFEPFDLNWFRKDSEKPEDLRGIDKGGFTFNPHAIFLQYTGLKDKSELHDIYEGDLVRWNEGIYEIKWSGEFGWIMKDDRDDQDCPRLYAQEYINRKGTVRVEVIGNIYENPDLFERLTN
jgi:uncharacterized phage protein (TIGR01671 family)